MVKKLKDKKIEIYKKEYITDDIGNQTEEWVNLTPTPIWAYFRQLSGTERAGAAISEMPIEEIMFKVNYRTDLTTYHVIKFKGIYYEITRIDPFEGYKEDISIYCKLPPRQSGYPQ